MTLLPHTLWVQLRDEGTYQEPCQGLEQTGRLPPTEHQEALPGLSLSMLTRRAG